MDAVQGITAKLSLMALNAYSARHEVIAHNIANVDVAGFQPLRLNFEEQLQQLQQALKAGAPDSDLAKLVSAVHPYAQADSAEEPLLGDSSVRLDQQMSELAVNTIHYEALLSAWSKESGLLRIAITGQPT